MRTRGAGIHSQLTLLAGRFASPLMRWLAGIPKTGSLSAEIAFETAKTAEAGVRSFAYSLVIGVDAFERPWHDASSGVQ